MSLQPAQLHADAQDQTEVESSPVEAIQSEQTLIGDAETSTSLDAAPPDNQRELEREG